MEQEPVRKKPGLLELLEAREKRGASDAELVELTRKYLSKKAREQGVPIHGTFELTPLCNLDCKMCYVHLSEKQLRESGKRLLTVDEWKGIMQQAIDAGMTAVTLTGGEALLYPEFDALYLFLQERGIEIYVKTNGLLLSDERIRFFKEHVPTSIHVSLYGSDDETYEKVTGYRRFSQVLNAICRTKEAQLPVELMITPNRYMLRNLKELLIQVRELGVPYHIGSGLFSPRKETSRSEQNDDLTLDEYIELYKFDAELRKRMLTPTCAVAIDMDKQSQEPAYGLRCGGGRSNFAVNWKGEMTPCLMFQDISADLMRMGFGEAWKTVHGTVSTYPVPRECQGCMYQRLCPTCVVQHAYGAPLGHANPLFCERARRLVTEGLYSIDLDDCKER